MVVGGARARALSLPCSPSFSSHLAQAHLVRQDAVHGVVKQVDHPVQALDLVLAHRPRDDARLHSQAVADALRLALVRQQRVVLIRLRRAAVMAAAFLLLLGGGGRAAGDKVLE